MKNFVFHNPTRIYFGRGEIARLSDALPREGRILMLYGGGSIFQNGVYEQVKKAVEGRDVLEFGGIEANPTYETLMKAVDLARREEVTFLLSVGGGSALDGTKFVAAAIPFEGEPWDILSRHATVRSAIPLGAVLTLPATGSEMNGSSVISRKERQEKLSFTSRQVYPQFSILDPETTFSLPVRQVANGVVDTFVHVMEQYLTFPAAAALQDRFAESILQTLIEVGPVTLADPTDYDARATFMWSATMALNGIIGVGVPQDWASHAIGHELTALYGIDHARTLAAVLPSLMRVQRVQKRDKLVQYGRRVWGLTNPDDDSIVEDAIRHTAAFFDAMGLPATLTAYPEIDPETPRLVAERLEARKTLPIGERRDLDAVRIQEILGHSLAEMW